LNRKRTFRKLSACESPEHRQRVAAVVKQPPTSHCLSCLCDGSPSYRAAQRSSFRELELEGAFVAITISAVSIPLHVPLVTDHSTAGLEVLCVLNALPQFETKPRGGACFCTVPAGLGCRQFHLPPGIRIRTTLWDIRILSRPQHPQET